MLLTFTLFVSVKCLFARCLKITIILLTMHAGLSPLEYIPLAAIKAELEDLFNAANKGIIVSQIYFLNLIFILTPGLPFDETRMDYLLTCMEVNPDFKREKDDETRRWVEEIGEYCEECLESMKGFVSPQVIL